MAILRILYSPKGRIARLPYFGYSCLNFFIFVLVIVIPILLLWLVAGPGETLGAAGQFTVSLAPHSAWAGLVVVLSIVAALATFVSAAILTIKRLHDLGHSGWHVIWIVVLTSGASTSSTSHVTGVSV